MKPMKHKTKEMDYFGFRSCIVDLGILSSLISLSV